MRHRAKGFTLVEIMIVVAIIGILIAIAVPSFIKARETSRRTACLENQAKIEGAIQQWMLENNIQASAAGSGVDEVAASAYPSGEDPPSKAPQVTFADLVGPDLYLRKTPVCPGSGEYQIQNDGDVGCTYNLEQAASIEETHLDPKYFEAYLDI
jgi:prepilin-type N-terminal cleavage/methylation domain-containing protein